MKVFISWSGEASRAQAQALREWLPLALHYVEPWMSEVDIDPGERWSGSIAKELEATNFGIICLTRQNLNSPWILFEAGALAKSLESATVIPLLFDLEFQDISGPLAQFQAKKLERDDVLDVVQAINKVAEDGDDPTRTEQLFEALWPKLEEAVAQIPTAEEPAHQSRPTEEVLEELVASVRGLDGRLVRIARGPTPRPRRGRRSWERQVRIADVTLSERGDPLNLLILASAFQEDAPWLYELGVAAFTAVVEDRASAHELVSRFLSATERLAYNKADRRLFPDVDPRFIDYFLGQAGMIRGPRIPVAEGDKPNEDPVEEESSDEKEEPGEG